MADPSKGSRAGLNQPKSPPLGDLGFGSLVADHSARRFLNRNGTFNVRRRGLGFFESLPLYHYLLEVTWPRFLAGVAGFYLLVNALFALAYAALGPGAVSGVTEAPLLTRIASDFFFSVQTLSTIGYGALAPATASAHVLVTLEALVGIIATGVLAGVVFARFSRPTARIRFSDVAVIAPYQGGKALMFRIVNERRTELVEMTARVAVVRKRANGEGREFHALELERSGVTFFPLTWTIVHPLDEKSPLFGCTAEELRESEAEFLVLLSGFDETFAQIVHARSSYQADEVIEGASFRRIYGTDDEGFLSVDVRELNAVDPVAAPPPVVQ